MSHPIVFSTATPLVPNLINRSALRRGFPVVLITLALAWFALSPTARAVTPAPDGGYPNNNTAEGTDALFNLTTGSDNTANGFEALFSNATGFQNTATGSQALLNNTGNNNTALGFQALLSNTTGIDNVASGVHALLNNTTGNNNTANGVNVLESNTTGSANTACGWEALRSNTTGGANTVSGFNALLNNTTGYQNTATGSAALATNMTGANNTANGVDALYHNNGNNNTATGFGALQFNTAGSSNLALGFNAGSKLTTGSNNIDIGNVGVAGEAAKIRIGTVGTQKAAFVAGISGVTVASGVGVIINTNGQLGTVVSSARFKEAIKPMDRASEAILALKPVTFRYKHELDPEGIPQFGLVAEQVEKVNPDLVVRDEDGKVTTVRYEAVNAMLLNEFLKEHRKVQEQATTIAEMKKQIEVLTATMQKVSDELELSKPMRQVTVSD